MEHAINTLYFVSNTSVHILILERYNGRFMGEVKQSW